MNPFASFLVRHREQAGYASARAIYKSLGGRPFFGCTYKQYLNIEGGRSVPRPALAGKMASALRLAVHEGRRKDYVTAYLATVLGDGPFLEMVLEVLSAKGAAAPSPAAPMRQALRRSFEERTVPLSEEESDLIRKDYETYWSFTILANDRGRWSAEKIAETLDVPAVRVRAALRRLAEARLVSKEKDGSYLCPRAGRVFLHPRDELYVPKVISSLNELWDEAAKSRGAVLMRQHLFTRARESELRQFFPYLAQSVQGADIYSTLEKSPDTAFFHIEAMVRRVLPF